MDVPFSKCFLSKRICIFYHANRNDGVSTEMGTNNEGLVFVVADDPDSGFPFHPCDVVFKFTPELCIGNIVDEPDKTVFV